MYVRNPAFWSLFFFVGAAMAAVPWEQVLETKIEALRQAAANAVSQQRKTHLAPTPLSAVWSGAGNVQVETIRAWDRDGDGKAIRVTVANIPVNDDSLRIGDRIQVRFDAPINVLELGTGFAFWVRTPEGLDPNLRMGMHIKVQGTDRDPVIIADTPVRQRFGDNPHLVYFDWGYVFDHSMAVFKTPPHDFFTRVTGFDLTLVVKDIPRSDAQLHPVSGSFDLDGLQVVDWFDGSYDNSRFPSDGRINAKDPIECQGRTQQVALICARFGGEEGVASAIRAMDMMARIQSWDGSWPEMCTRLQGEFTHGMILADLARALVWLREQKRPELEETVTIRHWTMTRDDLYEQMLYRAAMSRAPGPFSKYRDTYCSGQGALESGCNRPMAYAIGQHLAARAQTDSRRQQRILDEYHANMNDLLAAQGMTAGGWPIFGEGDRYEGKGLHWDCGYTTDHVMLMASGSRSTDDPRWGEMMRKFDAVVTATILPDGLHMDGGLSERGHAENGVPKAADIIFQEALRHHAPALAQWGANLSERLWSEWPAGPTIWPAIHRWTGYALGAFLTWQVYDLCDEPPPRDLGVVFPRQWPVWTARWMNKKGEQVRESQIIAKPDGQTVNTFQWEAGQYPLLTAVPLEVKAIGDIPLEIKPVRYEGRVQDLPETASFVLAMGPVDGGLKETNIRVPLDRGVPLDVHGALRLRLSSEPGDVVIEFLVFPRGEGAGRLSLRVLPRPEPYRHLYAPSGAADVGLD